MTRDEAQQAVERIRELSGDPEAAHAREDDLRHEFIKAIANAKYTSIRDARHVAEIILETDEIDFPRWCA